jgi:two-component system sensor histidine kinase KdpD
MLDRVRETFAVASVTLLERTDDGWVAVANAGPAVVRPADADTEVPAGDRLTLALCGGLLRAEDQRLIGAFAAQAAIVLDHIRLSHAAAEAAPLAEANKVRTALLAAVGHDLRTPLAAAKASVTTLLSLDLDLDAEDRRELLQGADTSLDRLAALVDNLLDMSRLQAGAMSIDVQPTAVDEVVARALDDLGEGGRCIRIDAAEDLPLVQTDPGLLERVVANLAANGLRYSPAGESPRVTSSWLGERVEIRVIDRGPGIPSYDWDRIFLPFQRLGDTDNTTGIGLGLALARGLTEAMGGTLEPEETPGGGLTMVISLPAVSRVVPAAPGLRERDEAST